MKQRNPQWKRHLIIIIGAAMIAGLTACSSKKQKFDFDHAQEAIAACHQELATVKDQKDATIDELVTRINIWQELQDSTLTLMVRDSTLQNDARLASEFFAVTDSFRMVITRLAHAKQRSMADVVKLKVGTSASRKAMLTSDEFRSARQYYLDFNRRILQSAETCRNDIKAAIKREEYQIHLSSPEREQARPEVKTQKPLDAKLSANYRWLLIQPFLAMDNYATAMLTPQQEQTLTHLAEELPMLLAYVDGKDYAHSPKSETEKLSSVLSEYFLKCYLKSVL